MSQRRRGNVWQFVIEAGKTADGQRRQIRRSGFRTKREAKAAEDAERARGGWDLAPDGDRLTVEEYLGRWLAGKRKLNPRTARNYEVIIRLHIIPAIGKIRLQQLRPHHVKACYDAIQSPNQQGKAHSAILSPALEAAISLELIGSNPARRLRPESAPKEKRPFPDPVDVARVLTMADAGRFGALFCLAALTGLRRGELLGLRWEDIGENEIRVRRQGIRNGGGRGPMVLDPPKTRASTRSVAIGPDASALLQAQRRQQAAEKMAERLDYKDQGLVFANELGGIISERALNYEWEKATKAAGLPTLHLHDLRHVYATMSLAAGVPMKVVSQNLGHATITITMDLYSHVLPSLEQEAALKLEAKWREMSTR